MRARPYRTARRALAASLLFACATGCSDRPSTWSALLITIDTTRMDAPSLYGVTPDITPRLDALAKESVVYYNARTSVPLTLPAHASMLTGLYPPRSAVRVNGKRPLPAAADTLAEAASEAGIQTGAFVAAVVLASEFGLDQGFTTYEVPTRGNLETSFYDERPASVVIDSALAWLEERDTSRPFFLWVHLFDPHQPYEAPPEFQQGEAPSLQYLSEVHYADHELGRLFDALEESELLDETFIAVLSDHGEGLGEKGEGSHGDYCNDSTLRIPFLLRYPDGFRAGEASNEIVSVVDVAPTLAESIGLSMPASIDGQSLFRRTVGTDRGVYFESFGPWIAYQWSPITGWVDARGKYVHSSTPRFFDLAEDPNEEHDLIADVDVTAHRRAMAELEALPSLDVAGSEAIDQELRARIQGLGYAGVEGDEGPLPSLLASTGLRDPMSSVDLHAQLMEAYSFLNGGLYAEASAGFESALERDPLNPFALGHLATSLIREGRFADAVPVLQRLISLGQPTAAVLFNLGVSLHRLDRLPEARAAFEKASALAPEDERIRRYLEDLGGA